MRSSDRGGAEALTLLPNLVNQRYVTYLSQKKCSKFISFFNVISYLISNYMVQESLKETKPKFFLNNAGEVIKRTGQY